MYGMDDLGVDEVAMNTSNGPRRGREEQGNFLLEIHEGLAFFYELSDEFGRSWEVPINLEQKITGNRKVLLNQLIDMLQVKGLQGSRRSLENP